AEREVAAGDALRGREQVGVELPEHRREPRAEPAEAGDDLVGDEEDLVAATERAQRREVAGRRNDDATRALHRLDEHRTDRVRAFALDRLLGLGETPGAVLLGTLAAAVRQPDQTEPEVRTRDA